ncbi:helix-turn-helix domain-containing protein [Natrinema hispanicum]|uniref:Predicted DNA binding protein, contains HTH domain n=1 Tax=Natrinema hispanicum TaxID=392421 RepID=A0A1I0IEG5_9EURY|nr:helix-turn-helix domain-containing protein [Natrinema hispanicum]SET94973.1 Predicted DNA binding protein, contains HTH domain [Natrinema hispanicum]
MIDECLMTEFRIKGDDCPLADATRHLEETVDAAPPLLRDDGNVLLRFSSSCGEELTAELDNDDRVRYLYQAKTDGRYNYRCLSLHRCVVHELISTGFMIESLTYQNGNAILMGAVVGNDILKDVLETAGQTVGIQLQRVYSMRPENDDAVDKQWDITPAQEESLRYALQMGYFQVPRQTTAGEVADALGISKTAFLERLRRAQEALFSELFSDVDQQAGNDT